MPPIADLVRGRTPTSPPPAADEAVAGRPFPRAEFGGAGTEAGESGQRTRPRDAVDALLRASSTVPPDDVLGDDDIEEIGDATGTARAVSSAGSLVRADTTLAKAAGMGGGDVETERFDRADPTQDAVAGPDATEIQAPRRSKHLTQGTLRRAAALRRKRGIYGDVRYVFTALMGVRRARREVAEVERRHEVRALSRRRHLITLGRAAATMDVFDHPALGRARDRLSEIEEERAKHAGAVAASDAELDRVRRDREANVKATQEGREKAQAGLAEVARKLEPVEKEALGARKKASELRDEVQRIDKKIADTEALLGSPKAEKRDKAAIQADIATLRANKQAVLRDEPAIAERLHKLEPRIAELEAQRSEWQKKLVELERADADDQRRTLELLEAIGAKRKVVERAVADTEAARDNALFELGDRIYVDRPSKLTAQLSPIDRIDLEIGEDERRAMELREILSNVDRGKLARGLGVLLALGALAATIAYLLAA